MLSLKAAELERPVTANKSSQTPRISVVIPAYNCDRYIRQTLASVVAQEHPNLEIIVVDDGSTDNTRSVVQEFKAEIELVSQRNAGVAAARNTGLRFATGDYVAFLDADDWFYPSKLYKQAQVLNSDPTLGAVHGGWNIIDEHNHVVAKVEPWHNAPRLDLRDWLVWKPVQLGATLFRREWLDRVGGFDIELRQSEDTDLMLRLALEGCRFGWTREPTFGYRHHSQSTMRSRALEQADCLERSLDKVYNDHRIPKSILRQEASVRYYSTLWLAWHLFRTGHANATVPYLQRAARFSPYDQVGTVQDWLAQFTVWSEADGMDSADVRQMWPWFQKATHIEESLWHDGISKWDNCLTLWNHYVRGENAAGRKQLEQLKGLAPIELTSLISFYVLFTPVPFNLPAAKALWTHAEELGVVAMCDRHCLAHLYLSLFGRAIRAKQPLHSTSAFFAALRFGYKAKAWNAWSHFARSTIRYFTGRQPSGLIIHNLGHVELPPSTALESNRIAA